MRIYLNVTINLMGIYLKVTINFAPIYKFFSVFALIIFGVYILILAIVVNFCSI